MSCGLLQVKQLQNSSYPVLFDQQPNEFPQCNLCEELVFVGSVLFGEVHLDGFHDKVGDLLLVCVTPGNKG